MKRKTMIAAGAVVVAALAVPRPASRSAAAGNDDTDTPISGDACSAPARPPSPLPARAA